jgi:Fe-S cluster biogenesis protein NfuA
MIPTNVYAEMTPNPKTMKFVADRLLVDGNGVAEYANISEAKGSSTLAEQLFAFPFVEGVFIMSNFVTITKKEGIDWDLVVYELREFIREFLMNNEKAVEVVPERSPAPQTTVTSKMVAEPVVPTEFDEQIRQILEEYVRPAVENDGGLIDFKSFKDGIVTVTLRGSCSGCPSSLSTLKGGIETMLTQMMPEVKAVVAEEL